MIDSLKRITLYHAMDRIEYTTTYMSTFNEGQRQFLKVAQHVCGLQTFNLQTKDVHQPSPDPLKLDQHLFSIWRGDIN
jgi:hypothetical protein